MKFGRTLADLAKRPVHPLLDEIAAVTHAAFDKIEKRHEFFVRHFFRVHCIASDHRERRTANEFPFVAGPLLRLLRNKRSRDKQLRARLIAQIPGLEIGHPIVHLLGGHFLRVVNQRR